MKCLRVILHVYLVSREMDKSHLNSVGTALLGVRVDSTATGGPDSLESVRQFSRGYHPQRSFSRIRFLSQNLTETSVFNVFSD